MKAIKDLMNKWNTWYVILEEKATESPNPEYRWEAAAVKKSLDELREAYDQDASAISAPPLSAQIGYYCKACDELCNSSDSSICCHCSEVHFLRDGVEWSRPGTWVKAAIEVREA